MSGYLPLSGGTLTGIIHRSGILARNNISGGNISLYGGLSNYNDGGSLFLYDKSNPGSEGCFSLFAGDGTNTIGFRGRPDGTLVWGNKNIVRSAVTTSGTADANGTLGQGVLFTG